MKNQFKAAMAACVALSLLNGCASVAPGSARVGAKVGPVEYQQHRVWRFAEGVVIDNDFEGARISDCAQRDPGEYQITIKPENVPINDSPWYAFRVSASTVRSVAIHLAYESGNHRYPPVVSLDGRSWIRLPAESYSRSDNDVGAMLRLEIGPEPLWVAGQEMIGNAAIEAWSRTLERLPFVTRKQLGASLAGRPLNALEIRAADPEKAGAQERPAIIIIGRQHPPEVTGTLGLFSFVQAIVGDSDLARRFREHFDVYVVPLMNPDGVSEGHWRHGLNGIDINRDWEKFTHPETRAIRDFVLQLKASSSSEPYLFFDFHSTFHDVFYIPPEDSASPVKGFTTTWLQAIQQRFPDYPVQQQPRIGTDGLPTSTAWAYKTLGIPAITYEWGDATDRALLATVAGGAAEEMMRLMLDATSR